MKSLNETLAYENLDLLTKFAEFYDFPEADCLFIFEQLKKWLWVKALHVHQKAASPSDDRLHFHFHVMPGLRIIDELWHIFILFTEDYRRFCFDYLHVFVDHSPSLPHKQLSAPLLQAELEKQLYFIGRNLDAATLQLWFRDLRNRFPETLINSRYIYRARQQTV